MAAPITPPPQIRTRISFALGFAIARYVRTSARRSRKTREHNLDSVARPVPWGTEPKSIVRSPRAVAAPCNGAEWTASAARSTEPQGEDPMSKNELQLRERFETTRGP